MVNTKDWKEYGRQLTIYQEVKFAAAVAYHEKDIAEWEKDCARVKAETPPDRFVHFPYPPSFPIYLSRYRNTVEDCLDWITAGRPSLARKLHVKRL